MTKCFMCGIRDQLKINKRDINTISDLKQYILNLIIKRQKYSLFVGYLWSETLSILKIISVGIIIPKNWLNATKDNKKYPLIFAVV